jgi:hypothetical protein
VLPIKPVLQLRNHRFKDQHYHRPLPQVLLVPAVIAPRFLRSQSRAGKDRRVAV